jgi:hypothetical protein
VVRNSVVVRGNVGVDWIGLDWIYVSNRTARSGQAYEE